jgi:hypothetical protein
MSGMRDVRTIERGTAPIPASLRKSQLWYERVALLPRLDDVALVASILENEAWAPTERPAAPVALSATPEFEQPSLPVPARRFHSHGPTECYPMCPLYVTMTVVERYLEAAYALVVAAAAMIYPPAALAVAAVFLIALAVVADRREVKS